MCVWRNIIPASVRWDRTDMTPLILLFLFTAILSSNEFTKHMNSNTHVFKRHVPGLVKTIFSMLCELRRSNVLTYSYSIKDMIGSLTLLRGELVAERHQLNSLEKGSPMAADFQHRLNLEHFTLLKVLNHLIERIDFLLSRQNMSDKLDCLIDVLSACENPIAFKQPVLVPYESLLATLASTGDNTKPLGARRFRKYDEYMIGPSISEDYNPLSIWISVLFIDDVFLTVGNKPEYLVLGPSIEENIFSFVRSDPYYILYELVESYFASKTTVEDRKQSKAGQNSRKGQQGKGKPEVTERDNVKEPISVPPASKPGQKNYYTLPQWFNDAYGRWSTYNIGAKPGTRTNRGFTFPRHVVDTFMLDIMIAGIEAYSKRRRRKA